MRANVAVQTIIVYGIKPDAFSTIELAAGAANARPWRCCKAAGDRRGAKDAVARSALNRDHPDVERFAERDVCDLDGGQPR